MKRLSWNNGVVLRWGSGDTSPSPRFTCCPQIQKLADRSDLISEVPKCSKIQIFRGSAPGAAGGSLQRSPDPLVDGDGLTAPSQEHHPALGLLGLVSTGLRFLRVSLRLYGSNPLQSWQTLLMIGLKCRHMEFVFFRFRGTETMDSAMKVLMGAMPPVFWC